MTGVYYRVRTYSTGQRRRLALSPGGKILWATPVRSRVKRTGVGKRLARRRRRISR